MSRLRAGQSGFTLVEVLIVSSLFLVVLSATLTSVNAFERLNRDQQRTDDQTERVRRAVDRSMRQLRNLANRSTTGEPTIGQALADDFVFQTSDPQRTWVRICTQQLAGGKARLWSLANATATTAPASTSCPGTNTEWPSRNIVASNLTNKTIATRQVPLLTYGRNCENSTSLNCTTDRGSITSVSMEALLDDDLAKTPAEVRVSSGVFLRNQNEKPTADYTWRPGVRAREVILNGSGSVDPEGRTLKYFWYRGDAPAGWSCATPAGTANVTYYQGVSLTYTFQNTDPASGQYADFTLMVCDPGDLSDDYKAIGTDRVRIP